jgi:hypothetical protein
MAKVVVSRWSGIFGLEEEDGGNERDNTTGARRRLWGDRKE